MRDLIKRLSVCAVCFMFVGCSSDSELIDLSTIPTVEVPATATPRPEPTEIKVALTQNETNEAAEPTVETAVVEAEPIPTEVIELNAQDHEEAGTVEPVPNFVEGQTYLPGESVTVSYEEGQKIRYQLNVGETYFIVGYSFANVGLLLHDEVGNLLHTEDNRSFGDSIEITTWVADAELLDIELTLENIFSDTDIATVSVFETGDPEAGSISRPVATGEAFLVVAQPPEGEEDMMLLQESQTGEFGMSFMDNGLGLEAVVLYEVQDNQISTINSDSQPIDGLIYTIPLTDPACCETVEPLPVAPAVILPITAAEPVTRLADETYGYELQVNGGRDYLIATQSEAPTSLNLFDTDGNLLREVRNDGFGATMLFTLWEADSGSVVLHPVFDSDYDDDEPSDVKVSVIEIDSFSASPVELTVAEGETYLIVGKPDGNHDVGLSMTQGAGSFAFYADDQMIEVHILDEAGDYEISALSGLGDGDGSVFVMPLEDAGCCVIKGE